MDNKIQLISDGDGLAVIGNKQDVKKFLESLGLLSLAKDLGFGSVLRAGAGIAEAGSEIAANSGMYLKVTRESAEAIKEFGLMESKTPGVSHAMLGKPGFINKWIQIETGPGSLLTNPAILAGAAGIMAQLARQQEMNEIKAYLEKIDKKVDEVLRNQKYAEWAKMAGAGSVIKDAMIMRETEGSVDDDTWSTVQRTPETIAATQRYALALLGGIADDLENTTNIRELAKMTRKAESDVPELLAVLAGCFELQDAIDVLRLDRKLEASPDEANRARVGLSKARQGRRDEILGATEVLMSRMDVAADMANSNVLLHPRKSRAVVGSINHVGVAVDDFHGPFGVEPGRDSLEATGLRDAVWEPGQWSNAVKEAGPQVIPAAAGVAVTGVVIAKAVAKRGA